MVEEEAEEADVYEQEEEKEDQKVSVEEEDRRVIDKTTALRGA